VAEPVLAAATVEFVLSDEQRALRSTARDFCAQTWPETRVRDLTGGAGPGADRRDWRRLGSELGLLGLTVPEELGGVGAGVVELCLVAEELGRVLALGPVLGSWALATTLLVDSGDRSVQDDVLPGVMEGTTLLAVAATGPTGAWLPATPDVTAQRSGDGWRLTGASGRVVDAVGADALLVLAGTAGGPSLFLVASDAAGLVRSPLTALDTTRPQANVQLSDTPARLVGTAGAALPLLRRASDLATMVLAAEAVGGMQRMLELTVTYAGTRLQFGRVIGSFQGVKHRCANMLVAVEHSRSAAHHAAWAFDTGLDDTALAASLAHVVCARSYLDVVDDAVQVHGGIGFTWEHPAHLYYKRAVSGAALLGGRAFHHERLAALVLEEPS
jgi:acyl-CoA dehydrogenase